MNGERDGSQETKSISKKMKNETGVSEHIPDQTYRDQNKSGSVLARTKFAAHGKYLGHYNVTDGLIESNSPNSILCWHR